MAYFTQLIYCRLHFNKRQVGVTVVYIYILDLLMFEKELAGIHPGLI